MRIIISWVFGLCTMGSVIGQELLVDSSKNHIENINVLAPFFEKLTETKQGKYSLRIVHIGDSHIQAGFFTSQMRELFQKDYGNAGRGLVFPYRLAGTNGHMDVRFSSDILWSRYRIITSDAPKVGIAGATIYTKNKPFYIRMQTVDTPFSTITIDGEGLDEIQLAVPKEGHIAPLPIMLEKIYRVKSGDVLGKIARRHKVTIKQLKEWNNLRSDRINIGQRLKIRTQKSNTPWKFESSNFIYVKPYEHSSQSIKAVFENPVSELYLINKGISNSKEVTIYGLNLSNQHLGVTYDGIGFNGAKYFNYNDSEMFFEQLAHYSPDLLIVSLGTNEAFDKVYKMEQFRSDLELFFGKIEKLGIKNILLTTPPSALRSTRYENPKLEQYANVLKEFAYEKGYAVWDLFATMNGVKGMKYWYKKGLAGKDRIHFTEEGYRLQANLLYDALIHQNSVKDE